MKIGKRRRGKQQENVRYKEGGRRGKKEEEREEKEREMQKE